MEKFIKTILILVMLMSIQGEVFSQWIIQHSGLPPSPNPTLIFSAVDTNVCWGIQTVTLTPLCVLTTDGGDHWGIIQLPFDTGLTSASIFALSKDVAWISLDDPEGTARGGIFKTTNGGIDWVKQESAFPGSGAHPRTLYFFDPDNGLCTGRPRNGYWEIYTTSDGGTNWIRVPSADIPEMDPGDIGGIGVGAGNSFWFNSASRSVYRTTDRGLTWSVTRHIFPASAYFLELAIKDEMTGIACSYYGDEINKISMSSDGGATWSLLPAPPSTPSFEFVNFVPGTTATYFITAQKNIGYPEPASPGSAFTIDGGLTWTIVDTLPHGKSSFADNKTGWSAGVGDTIFKWRGLTLGLDKHSQQNEGTLSQNYPNPFTSATTISYQIPSKKRVVLKVCDVRGIEIVSLVNEEKMAGSYTVTFDASGLKSGIYYYCLQAGETIQTRKLCILRE